MRQREWQKLRRELKPTDRGAVTDALRGLYEHMGWPRPPHVLFCQAPNDYCRRTNRENHWNWTPVTLPARLAELCVSVTQDQWRDPWAPFQLNGMRALHRRPRPKLPARHLECLLREAMDFAPVAVPVVLEKPLLALTDVEGRPHNPEGPTVVWPNGDRYYWFNGVRVTRRFIEVPPTLDYIRRQDNIERRRVLIERYGEQRYLQARGAKLRSEDEHGKLWEIPYRGGGWWAPQREEEVYVQVTNASAEPDGTFRTFFLRVPPRMVTPQEAVAWTFKLAPHNYKPKVQT